MKERQLFDNENNKESKIDDADDELDEIHL